MRVVNGARPPTMTLPAGGGALRLVALNPGSREYLRASVDYDGLTAGGARALQPRGAARAHGGLRAGRGPGDLPPRLDRRRPPGATSTDVLLQSRLVRVLRQRARGQRPDRSAGGPGGVAVGYTLSNPDGDDGAPLTDYDVIGSAGERHRAVCARRRAALQPAVHPAARARPRRGTVARCWWPRASAASAMRCWSSTRPCAWTSARASRSTACGYWPFRSDSAVMYYPRVQAFDRLRGRVEIFGSCGAAAGMIARSDETCAGVVGRRERGGDTASRPAAGGSGDRTPTARAWRRRASIRCCRCAAASRAGLSPRTLAAGGSGASDWKYLSARRLALFIAASIEQGTRWVLLEHNGPATWERAQAQVEAFLDVTGRAGRLCRRGSRRADSFRDCRRARQSPADPRRRQVQPAVRLRHQQARRASTPGW